MKRRLNLRYSVWRRLENGPLRLARPRRRDVASYRWSSLCFSAAARLQQAAFREALQQAVVRPDPVFVIGFWRSGTTLLHQILASNPQVRWLTTRECMNPNLILQPVPVSGGPTGAKRPMDQVVVESGSPQEDEFALLALGAPSLYRAFLAPALLQDPGPLLDPTLPSASSAPGEREWESVFEDLLRMVAVRDGRPLLLKSPTHLFRVQRLAERFPEARFVLITRDPDELWCSNRSMWSAMLQDYALSAWSFTDIEPFLVRALLAYRSQLDWLRSSLPAWRLIETSYAALTRQPLVETGRIWRSLQWSDADLDAAATPVVATLVGDYPRTAHRVPADVARMLRETVPELYALPAVPDIGAGAR